MKSIAIILIHSCLFFIIISNLMYGAEAVANPLIDMPSSTSRSNSSSKLPWQLRRRVGVQVTGSQGPEFNTVKIDADMQSRFSTIDFHQLHDIGIRPRGMALVDLSLWPPEPPPEKWMDVKKLSDALQKLCPVWISPQRIRQYARWIVQYSIEFNVDPSLLSALIVQQSRCQYRKENSYGSGLAMINPSMHAQHIKNGLYRYWVMNHDHWQPQRLPVNRFKLDHSNLLSAEANIYFAAAFLKIFQQQCPGIDKSFNSVPHRHAVSHFIWGDRVRDAGVEDPILLTRRRLLNYYFDKPQPAPRGRFQGLSLSCPLEAPPRKITSVLGDDREGGRRRHTGIDFYSTQGEPVRAIAPGRIIFAGIDLGSNEFRNIDPCNTRMVIPTHMGPRGLFVTIQHTHELTSSYMHLASYKVQQWQNVQSGDLIGYVGRSGMKTSSAHLHFEIAYRGKPIDPMPYLKPYLFPPEATHWGLRKNTKLKSDHKRQDSSIFLGPM